MENKTEKIEKLASVIEVIIGPIDIIAFNNEISNDDLKEILKNMNDHSGTQMAMTVITGQHPDEVGAKASMNGVYAALVDLIIARRNQRDLMVKSRNREESTDKIKKLFGY